MVSSKPHLLFLFGSGTLSFNMVMRGWLAFRVDHPVQREHESLRVCACVTALMLTGTPF